VLDEWFLTDRERGNPASDLSPSTEGNSVRALVHGADYFARLAEEVAALRQGDHLFFTDWRGDADERLGPDGPTVGEAFAAAVERGVAVKGLMWRAHRSDVGYSETANRRLGEAVRDAGGEVLLDQRVRRAGSHHQKLVVLRHPGRPERDVAFAGGIDLCHGRRDDADHGGDPQSAQLAADYGDTPPWHDVQLELRGPVVGALDLVFRERWTDPRSLDTDNPLSWLEDRLRRVDLSADPLPERPPDPPVTGTCHVQVLRTYPAIRPRTPYAPRGERSVARGFAKALRRARRLVYIEDQYMWSPHIARLLADALRRSPQLHVVVVLPRHPDVDGRLALPPNEVGRVTRSAAWRPSRPCSGSPGTGSTCSTWRTGTGRRCTCTRRWPSSTTSGRASAARTSTAARGRTTRSCPAPSSTPTATPASPPTPPDWATGPGSSPATCG
jgi:phosphatidylserine/phosphatidylglycerophosphate/cardiolipin synthase-like enzyme